MKWLNFLAAFSIFAVSSLRAQVTVEVVLDQEHFLANETLVAKVRIANSSGQTLKLGKEEDWLSISVESKDGVGVNQLAQVPVVGEFTLESSYTAIRKVDLAPCFDLTQPGRYAVTATVKVPNWNQVFLSNPKIFDISRGSRLADETFGVPPLPGEPAAAPVIRKYILISSQQVRDIKLYLRLTDETESRSLKVFNIGTMVSFSKPEHQLDKWSNLHILYQTSARGFNYSIVSPDGLLISRENYDYSASRPILSSDREGKIVVKGGTRRPIASDIPPPDLSAPPLVALDNLPAAAKVPAADVKSTPDAKPPSP